MKRPKHKIVPIEELKSVVNALFMQYNEIQIATSAPHYKVCIFTQKKGVSLTSP